MTLSPLKTLARGYSITEKEGKIVHKVSELKQGDRLTLRFEDGKSRCRGKINYLRLFKI